MGIEIKYRYNNLQIQDKEEYKMMGIYKIHVPFIFNN